MSFTHYFETAFYKYHDLLYRLFITNHNSSQAVGHNMLAYLSLLCYHDTMAWEIEFYKDNYGKEPLTEFLNDLPIKTRARVAKLINLLAEYGVLLKEPYTRQIKGKIRELRVKDNLGHIRVLYFTFTGRRFVLLHGFLKKTDKTPEREIELAEKRMMDFLERDGGRS